MATIAAGHQILNNAAKPCLKIEKKPLHHKALVFFTADSTADSTKWSGRIFW